MIKQMGCKRMAEHMRRYMLGHGLFEDIFIDDIAHTAVPQTGAALIGKNEFVVCDLTSIQVFF